MRRILSALCVLGVFCGSFSRAAEPASAPAAKGNDVVVDEASEKIIKGALKFLATKQSPGGAWSNNNSHPAAYTGYVLMAFLSTGNLPGEGEFGKNVARGTQYLLQCARADGLVVGPAGDGNMYDHGIATIALGELYGQTSDQLIRPKLERAIKLIIKCQNQQGGWRYPPAVSDADISVTVLQVVALCAAKNAGIDVPQATIDKAVGYVKSCYDKNTGGFSYQPHGGAGFGRTAAAIYSLQVCGQYDDPSIATGSKFLFDKRQNDREWFTYGAFYAAPAQYMIGGDTWKKWYEAMRRELLQKVKRQGDLCSWDPLEGMGKGINDVYATAVYTTTLAMPYHYVPLYQR